MASVLNGGEPLAKSKTKCELNVPPANGVSHGLGKYAEPDTPNAEEKFVLADIKDEDEMLSNWTNHALDIYKENVGDERFNSLLNMEYTEKHESHSGGLISNLGTKLKKTKLGMKSNSAIVSVNGQTELPGCVGGTGFAVLAKNPKYPTSDFFSAGRCFPMRLRHSNLSFADDASLDGRVACIKFADSETGGPWDLVLHTGRTPQYFTASSYEEFLKAFKDGTQGIKEWTKKTPRNYVNRVESLRFKPTSYYNQRYYSHITYNLDHDNKERASRLARFRMIPMDGCEETGLLSREKQENVWETGRDKDDPVAKDYLKEEYRTKLKQGPFQYRLQIQLREWIEKEEKTSMNPCIIWDHNLYPWIDLATLTVALSIPEEIIAKTKYDLMTLPPDLKFSEGGVDDFSSLPEVLRPLHSSLEKPHDAYTIDPKDRATYIINVVTGKVGNAGTDADVYITLYGKTQRSAPINLDNKFHDDFEAGQMDAFEIQTVDVGHVEAIRLELRSMLPGRQWLLDFVTVTLADSDVVSRFPCYTWLTSSNPTAFFRGSDALLAKDEKSMFGLLYRRCELDEKREEYHWLKQKGLMGVLKAENYSQLPREARFNQEKEVDLMEKHARTLANMGLGKMRTAFQNWDPINDCKSMWNSVLKEKKVVKMVHQNWMEDAEFARQFLNGPNPTVIKRVTQLPKNFAVTQEKVGEFLDSGCTLTEEIKAGHIYIATYPDLDPVVKKMAEEEKPQVHLRAPMCLFHVNSKGVLMPIAIQLTQTPDPKTIIWTPNDAGEWIFAKMFIRQADAHMHHLVSRMMTTYNFMEVICVATRRNLPSVHPVFKLLVPHFRYTLAVNVSSRQDLHGLIQKYLAVKDLYPIIIQEAYKRFKLDHLDLPKDLHARGVDDPELLPNYYFRDDGLKLWKLIKKFVLTMMMIHYWTDVNVEHDEELQTWIKDICMNGFPVYTTDHGVPNHFKTISSLVDFLTVIIFTATGRHAALSGGIMDYYGFCANIPTMLAMPPPKKRGTITMETISKSLPNKSQTADIIASVYTLARVSRDELFLGEFPDDHFVGEMTDSVILALKEDLKRLSEEIHERNKNMDIPYTYLLPENVPNSIAN